MKSNHYFGFDGIDDFLHSLFGLKNWALNSVIALLGVLTTFITGFIWDSPEAIYTLWALMAVDWVTGILKSMKNKDFVSYKLWRMPLYFVVTSFVISISWWMAKSSLIFTPLPALVLSGFYSVYFVSLLENLGAIDLLPKSLVKLLKSKFGLKVIVDKWTKEEAEKKASEDKE